MLATQAFDIHPLPLLDFGVGTLAGIGRHLGAIGGRSVLMVTDPGLVAAGVAARVGAAIEGCGLPLRVFDGVRANPTTADVEAGSALLRRLPDAIVVALGGGSALDAGKAIALHGANDGPVTALSFGCAPEHPGRPVLAIPTTAGTGAETNMFGVITDEHVGRKFYVAHPSILPRVALLDPALTVGAPPSVTAACGMDALTHAIEALTSQRSNPVAAAFALAAIERVARHLPAAVADGGDMAARAEMLIAANLAASAFASAGLGLCHAMGHPLSARLHAAHGQTLATLLPYVMAFNLDTCTAGYARVAAAMGVATPGAAPARDAAAAIDAVRALSARVGTARGISALGGQPDMIDLLVEDALADMVLFTTPRPPLPEQVAALYRAAW